MHLQIKGSPHDTAGNLRQIVNVLARADINIMGIGPDFDTPHVRLLVSHEEHYDPRDESDDFNKALKAMEEDGLTPEVRAGVLVEMPDVPGALKIVLDRISRDGYELESLLVLPGMTAEGKAQVAFGVARDSIQGWDTESGELEDRILVDLEELLSGS